MCKLCGDPECVRGSLCGLPDYVKIPAVKDAIDWVQGIDPSFIEEGFGVQWYSCGHGLGKLQKRPSPVGPVWAYFKRKAERGYDCPYCLRTGLKSCQVDHIVAWRAYICKTLKLSPDEDIQIPLFIARVLASDPDNLEPVCPSCNESKQMLEKDDPYFPAWRMERALWGAEKLREAKAFEDGSKIEFAVPERPKAPLPRRPRTAHLTVEEMERKRRMASVVAFREQQHWERRERYRSMCARREAEEI